MNQDANVLSVQIISDWYGKMWIGLFTIALTFLRCIQSRNKGVDSYEECGVDHIG